MGCENAFYIWLKRTLVGALCLIRKKCISSAENGVNIVDLSLSLRDEAFARVYYAGLTSILSDA